MERINEITEKVFGLIEWLDKVTPKKNDILYEIAHDEQKETRDRLDEIKDEALTHLNLKEDEDLNASI